MRNKFKAVLLLIAALLAMTAHAQDYPNRTIKLILPYPPGGTTDILSRLIADKLSQAFNQTVMVDNRPGGNSIIATNAVAQAQPDGYTIGMFLTTLAVNPYVTKSLPFDTEKDLAPVALIAIVPGLMVANADTPVKNLQDVIKLAKAQPGKLNYGSPGPLTSGHLSMELMKKMAGIDIMHVPYKGGQPSVLGLLQNQVQFSIGGPPSLMQHVAAGKIRTIAVTTANRVPSLPNVPTMAEQGLVGYDTFEWYGILAPGGTPKAIVDKLNREILRILDLPDMQEKLAAQGAIIEKKSPEEFRLFIKSEMTKWKAAMAEMNFKIEN